jgi:hypothetical protein
MYEMEGPQLVTCHQSADCSANHGSRDLTAKIRFLQQSPVAQFCLPRIAPRLGFPLDCE